MSLGVLREPAFDYALLLLVHLQDTPEARKSKATQDSGNGLVWHEQGCAGNQNAHDGQRPDEG